MPRALAALVIVVGVSVVVMLVILPGADNAPVRSGQTGEQRASVEEADGPARLEEIAIRTQTFEDAAPARAPADAPRVRLAVVVKPAGTPAAGARITYYDNDAWRAASPGADREPFTHRFTADADGVVMLPEFRGQVEVEGRLGRHWGRTWLRKPLRGPPVLALEDDRAVRVHVLDATGRPASGVAVALRSASDDEPPYRYDLVTLTGADGVAVLEHVQAILGRRGIYVIAPAIPLLDPPVVPIAMETLPAEEVTLRLPPTGSLAVRCIDVDGRPVLHDRAFLRITAHAGEPETSEPIWKVPWPLSGVDASGEARLRFVGPGLWFRAVLTPGAFGPGIAPASADAPGPAAGEQATMTVVYGARRLPVVTGRFVRNDGTPLPKGSVCAIDVLSPDHRSERGWQKVDVEDGGRFRLAVRETCPAGGTYLCELQELDGDGRFIAGAVKVHVDVAPFREPTDHEIGDVVIDVGPPLVAGRVVDQRGQGVVDLEVWVMEERDNGPMQLPGLELRQPGDGLFSVQWPHGKPLPRGRLRLQVASAWATDGASHEFIAGDAGVQLTLQLGGCIVGSMDLAGSALVPRIQIWCVSGQRHMPTGPDKEGRFEFRRVTPGPATVIVATTAGMLPIPEELVLARVDGVDVVPGVETRDPRLQGLRLPADLGSVRLTILDASERPINGAWVWSDKIRMSYGVSNADGDVVISGRAAAWDVVVTASGYCPTRVAGIVDDRTIVLKPGLLVRIAGDGAAEAVPALSDLSAELVPDDETARRSPAYQTSMSDMTQPFDAHARATFRLPFPGRYEVRWHVRVPGNRARMERVAQDTPPTILVEDTGGEQTFALQVPVAAARRVLAEAR